MIWFIGHLLAAFIGLSLGLIGGGGVYSCFAYSGLCDGSIPQASGSDDAGDCRNG
jgi:hypothetical protein